MEQNIFAGRKRQPDGTGPRIAARRAPGRPGTLITLEADAPVVPGLSRSVWLVKSGILRIQRRGEDGARQILSLALPGEVVGHEGTWREGLGLETATPCTLCRFDRGDFDRMLEGDATMRKAFDRQQKDQLERLRWLTWSIGTLRPEERLSAFLALATQFMPWQPLPDGSGVLTIVLTRADIADLLATTVETISRFVHRLDEAGVIEIADPTHLKILDMAQLQVRGGVEQIFGRLPFHAAHPHLLRSRPAVACAER